MTVTARALWRIHAIVALRHGQRKYIGAFLAGLVALLALGSTATADELYYKTVSANPSVLSESEAKLLRMINDDRQEHLLWPLKVEPVLSQVARRHSDDMQQYNFLSYDSPRLGEIRYQVARAGISTAMVRYQIYQAPSAADVMTRTRKGPRAVYLERDTHIGIGVSRYSRERGCYITLIFIQCQALVNRFPSLVQPREKFVLSGVLFSELRQPKVAIIAPPGPDQRGGNVVDVPVSVGKNGAFKSQISFDRGPGEYIIEVSADGPLGPVVTDLLRVYAGVPYPPPEPPRSDEAFKNEKQAQDLMLALINQDRARFNLKPLALDVPLSGIARAHSADMMQNDYFAHTSPTAGDLTARLKAAGILLKASGENIAADSSVRRAQQNLMESPQHRKNILSTDFDRVGLGIVADSSGTLYVTQEFGSEFTEYDPETCAKELLAEMNKMRAGAKLGALRRTAELDRIAAENSKAMSAQGKLDAATASRLLTESQKARSTLTLVLMSSDKPTLENVEQANLENTLKFDQVGIGVLGQKPANGPPCWWTTVVLATERR